LLLDVLINFSREYLPKTRGGMMDAPLVITTILNPLEVDSEVYNMDAMFNIPLQFYRISLEYPKPDEIEGIINNIEKRLGKPEQYSGIGFSHDTSCIDMGPVETSYKKLKSMKNKIEVQFELMRHIKAVNIEQISDKILEVHLLPDIMGNLRAYGSQQFRCINCNARFRRLPLKGICPRCGGRIVQTIYRRTVLKYVPIAKHILERYGASNFNSQRFKIFEATDLYILSGVQEKDKLLNLLNKVSEEASLDDKSEDIVKKKRIISLEEFIETS